MANMSYCRFTNTSRDLNDCLDALTYRDSLSEMEIRGGKAMFKEFLEFCKDNRIIGDYDKAAVDSLFDSLAEQDDEMGI